MASIKIILRKGKNRLKVDGTARLMLQIIHSQKSTEISLGKSIPIENWDPIHQRVIGDLPNKAPINTHIQSERVRYEKIMLHKQALGEEFTVAEIVAEGKGIDLKKVVIAEYLKYYIADNPENLSYNTIRNYISTRAAIKQYDPNITFQDLTPDRLQDFEQYLRKKLKNRINTIHGRMKVLRKLSRAAVQRGWIKKSPFEDFKLKLEKTNRGYLIKEEVDQLGAAETSSKIEELVLDCFRFSCFTGLRFSDICLLRKDNIQEANDAVRLTLQMAKTKEALAFNLPTPGIEILRKWNTQKQKNTLIFPILSGNKDGDELQKEISSNNAYFNKILKGLVKKAGIEKQVSFHVARHTFATLALSLGISMEVLSKLLGHQDLKTTQIYGKIMDESKDEAMSLFDGLDKKVQSESKTVSPRKTVSSIRKRKKTGKK